MQVRLKQLSAPDLLEIKWLEYLLVILIIFAAGLAGMMVSGIAWVLVGREFYLLPVLIIGVVGLSLCIVKYDAMVFLTFLLFGVVRFEPAPSDFLIILLFAVGLLTGKLLLSQLSGSSTINFLIWGFVSINLISILVAGEILTAVRYAFITFYMIVFVYFIKMYLRSNQAMRYIIMGYLFSAFISVFLVMLGYLGIGTDWFLSFGTRAKGLFKDTNVYGPFLIFPILFLVDEIIHSQLIPGRLVAKWLGVIALSIGVFLSGSRAAWGNLILALLLYFVLTGHAQIKSDPNYLRKFLNLKVFIFLFTVIFVILSMLALFVQVGGVEFVQTFLADRAKFQIYDTIRFARQFEGLNIGFTNLFGIGPGKLINAHSLYIRTFAEHGVFGIVFLLLTVFVLIVQTFMRRDQRVYGLSIKILFCCLVGLMLNSIVIDTIHWRHFWFILAMSWTLTALPETDIPLVWERNSV